MKLNRCIFQKNQNAEQEYMVWKCMSWNIRGWGDGQDKTKKKMKIIKSEIEIYDVIILTETHLSKEEEEINKMEKTPTRIQPIPRT